MSETQKDKPFDIDSISLSELADVSDPLLFDKQKTQSLGKKFIVFMLEDEHYAIASDRVSEVVRILPFTPLPNLPSWLLGLANLRGDVISIIDLHSLWKIKSQDSPKSKLIVLRPENSDSLIAFKVDKLREIVTLPKEQIEPAKENDAAYISGKSKLKSNIINLLDVDKILSSLKLN